MITTIHSPTSFVFGLFDRLLMLVDGRVAYHGEAGWEILQAYFQGTRVPLPPRRPNESNSEWLVRATTGNLEGTVIDTVASFDSPGRRHGAGPSGKPVAEPPQGQEDEAGGGTGTGALRERQRRFLEIYAESELFRNNRREVKAILAAGDGSAADMIRTDIRRGKASIGNG